MLLSMRLNFHERHAKVIARQPTAENVSTVPLDKIRDEEERAEGRKHPSCLLFGEVRVKHALI